MVHLRALEPELAELGGTVSIWYGELDRTAGYTRLPDAVHYPASTMKLAVLAAAYRLADTGRLDLDTEVEVHDEFDSAAPGAPPFRMDPEYDSDPQVWAKLGCAASLRWLARRMIVVSSNLATNLVLEHTGYAAATEAWRAAGAAHSVVNRGIEDYAARDAGTDNTVTAADLAALLAALATDRIASPAGCREMREILLAQQKNDDLPTGLPAGTRIAHKNGWVDGLRHDAGIVYPDHAPPYLLVACISSDAGDERVRGLMTRIAAASWAQRSGQGARGADDPP